MGKLIVLSERNILNYLLGIGLKPYAFYTDFEAFKSKSQLFTDNCVILVIFSGACAFSVKRVSDCIDTLIARVNNPNDNGISDVVVFSDFTITRLKDYYKFTDNPIEGVRYNGKEIYIGKDISLLQHLKIEPQKVKLTERLKYEPSEKVEEIYLEIESYKKACEVLKVVNTDEQDLKSKIKIPEWKFVHKY